MQTPKLSTQSVLLILLAALVIALLLKPVKVQAQRNPPMPVAQVSAGSPLPVYVVNDQRPSLPEGFVAGSSWKFTTWTTPSTLTFTATVQKTDGGWALLALNNSADAKPNWYYVPHMPGAWEPQ
jgi:hypothetical protein